MLEARQGDPESPASGTLYARRQRLQAELEWLECQESAARSGVLIEQATAQSQPFTHRSAASVERALRTIEEEIDAVQARIKEIHRLIGWRTRKN